MTTTTGHDKSLTTPFIEHLGITILERGEGTARCRLPVQPVLENRRGFLHGGALFGLVDTTMGVAQFGTLEPEEASATLEVQISYIKPVKEGQVECTARVIKRGRRIIFLEAEVTATNPNTAQNEIIATATGSFALLANPQPASSTSA